MVEAQLRHVLGVVFCALLLLLWSDLALAQDEVARVQALSQADRDVFYGSKEDPAAIKLLGVNEKFEGRSYLAGDEWNLNLYYKHIRDLGGGYVGVGSDQGYMLMSWSKPEFAWLIDYDPLVIETHKIYQSFFKAAKTPKEFLGFWKKSGKKDALVLLEKDWKDDANYTLIVRVYKEWRGKILRRHRRIKKRLRRAKVPFYLSNQADYAYVKNMVESGRVRTMIANLLDDEGLVGVAAASKKLHAPIRVLYLSNAEEYWRYPKTFRTNIAAMNFDEQSFVLHTLSTWSKNKDYRYILQAGLNYKEWIASAWLKNIYAMVPRRKLNGPEDIDFIHFKRQASVVAKRRAKRLATHKKNKKNKKNK